jgi:hypothetical protein
MIFFSSFIYKTLIYLNYYQLKFFPVTRLLHIFKFPWLQILLSYLRENSPKMFWEIVKELEIKEFGGDGQEDIHVRAH